MTPSFPRNGVSGHPGAVQAAVLNRSFTRPDRFVLDMPLPPNGIGGQRSLICVRRCPTFPPGLGSIIGAGRLSFRVRDGSGRFPVAMSAVTLFTCFQVPHGVWGSVVFWWWGVVVFVFVGCGCEVFFPWFMGVCVSFRPVSASSLSSCDGCRSGLLIPWSAGGLILLKR